MTCIALETSGSGFLYEEARANIEREGDTNGRYPVSSTELNKRKEEPFWERFIGVPLSLSDMYDGGEA